MSFGESVKTCFSKYITFSGRASRSEYWWFALFVFVATSILAMIDAAMFGVDPVTQQPQGVLQPLFSLAIVLPFLAAGWRRMHDSGKPGWLLLLPMLVSFATFFMFMMGALIFSGLQNAGADPNALVGPAAVLGITGMFAAMVVQVLLAILLLWWLTRPSDPGTNDYGPGSSV